MATHHKMLVIDGSRGEGGGQVLRSALSLSLLTRTPITLTQIRARRSQPGLRPQHLKAVEAAAAIGGALVEGATLGSQRLVFIPAVMRAGEFRFDIGTAGAVSLVLQTIAVPLCFAPAAATITIGGGTHVPWSPCYHYLEQHWRHFMQRIGYRIDLRQEYAGFYPRGGGLIHAGTRPAERLQPLELVARGPLRRIRGISAVAQLDPGIAERQKAQALRRLAGWHPAAEIATETLPARSPGTFIMLVAEFEGSQCCVTALGSRGKPAEQVADEAVALLERFLATDGAIDAYLADQLLLPLACVEGESRLRSAEITPHLLTNAGIIEAFLPAEITIDGNIGQPGTVRISGVDTRSVVASPAREGGSLP